MTHTWEELHDMTVTRLREIAAGLEHEELHGYRTMHKEQLLPALCHALGIEDHAHHVVVGIDKSAIKAKIRELKVQRDAALAAGDSKQLKRIRRRIHRLKRELHKATV
jgi:DNA-binding IclR family transcriptional regulator